MNLLNCQDVRHQMIGVSRLTFSHRLTHVHHCNVLNELKGDKTCRDVLCLGWWLTYASVLRKVQCVCQGLGKKKSLLCDSFLLSPSQSLFLSFVNSVQCHGPRHAAEDKHVISVCMLRLTASNEGKFVWEISNFWYHIMALRSMRSPH